MTELNMKQVMIVFNDLADKVRKGVVEASHVQVYLTKNIINAPTEALRQVYREGYKTVFPDSKF
jgi:peptidyl-tRNA hydrolase